VTRFYCVASPNRLQVYNRRRDLHRTRVTIEFDEAQNCRFLVLRRMAPQVGLESTLKRSFNTMQASG
jgi:hypothetical protein